ncbi:YceI family protein [Caldithrix abyssi]|uniref:Polyisoprenoid-binding protein YceI n=1 Tax=Caldithrix abyssi DSM 13497 TaxID=880073 RepID=H1XVV1_CALAY|nr:YceI family protein [Caldithrix abyssi]APF20844.1 Polyisoprenoid-binding protein YceI [Caldithrix abyssi DSM 13497]EHO40678.1 YceI family protein [Caldithrix abyssi DSM 13497]
MRLKRVLFLIMALSLFSIWATEYNVNPEAQNLVKFISDAPIEDFEGVTSHIDGYIIWEGPENLQNAKFYFEVDLNTLDTGIGLRNRHMRENYLESDRFPKAFFEGTIVKVKKLTENHYQVETEGRFYCHGIKQKRKIMGEVFVNGEQLRIKSAFEVKLSDHQIEIPSIMFFKIDENMQVQVDFTVQAVKE